MTDKEDDAKLALQRCGVTWPSDNSIRVISVFLRDARNQALEEAAKFVEENYEEPIINIIGNQSWRERGPKNLAAAIRAMQSTPQSSSPAQSDGSTGSHNAHAPDAPDSSVYHKRGT